MAFVLKSRISNDGLRDTFFQLSLVCFSSNADAQLLWLNKFLPAFRFSTWRLPIYTRLIYISVHTLVNVPTYVATVLKNKIYSIKWNGFLSMERIAKHVIHKCQWNRLHGCETNPDLKDQSYQDRRSIRSWCNGWTSARLLSQEIFLCRSDSTPSRRQCFCHRWFQFSPPATVHLPKTIFVSSLLRTSRQSSLLRGSSPEWTRTSEMDAA